MPNCQRDSSRSIQYTVIRQGLTELGLINHSQFRDGILSPLCNTMQIPVNSEGVGCDITLTVY